jgi:hypothetical protein
MAQQRIHEKLGALNLLTKEEVSDVFSHHIDQFLRDRYRTIKLMKLPQQRGIATSATLNLTSWSQADQPGAQVGPESGFLWMLRRVIVSSNAPGDTAKYTLYAGSDVTLFDASHLLEGFTAGIGTVVTPAVPASGVQIQNPYPGTVQAVISGGTVTGVVVNNVPVGIGDGTYYVPAYGSIGITYSVVPTWVWTSISPAGNPVGVGYYPGTDATWLWPNEQVYAQVTGATAGNQYVLSGIAVESAAEMVAKLVGP